MRKHELNVWPEDFHQMLIGNKAFVVCKNDKDFQDGDILILKEYCPESNEYCIGEPLKRKVTYVLNGPGFGIEKDYCILSLINY